jgi:hypothetical protein
VLNLGLYLDPISSLTRPLNLNEFFDHLLGLDSLAQTPLDLLLQLGLIPKQRNLLVLHILSCVASLPEFLPRHLLEPLSKTVPNSLPESLP